LVEQVGDELVSRRSVAGGSCQRKCTASPHASAATYSALSRDIDR
jgi:hypothetical protein